MKKAIIIALSALIALASCTGRGMRQMSGAYSYKTTGSLVFDCVDSAKRVNVKTETGWMEIVREGENTVKIIKNPLNGKIVTIEGTVEENNLKYTYTRKVAVYFSPNLNATVPVKVTGKGRLYEGRLLEIEEEYFGMTPLLPYEREGFNPDYKITDETVLGIVGDLNVPAPITVQTEKNSPVMTVAEKND